MAGTAIAPGSLLSLSDELLLLILGHLHNIEDLMNLSSTCRRLRACSSSVTPNTILRLAAAQSRIFFRPSPHFLLTAVARELGHWARRSCTNETLFAQTCSLGMEGLLDLALQHCGLTFERIRHLHALRFDIINPVTDIIDKSVGSQWGDLSTFWSGGVSDPATIHADPCTLLFHLAMYGEVFGPDLEPFLDDEDEDEDERHPRRTPTPRLRPETRPRFLRYTIPDWVEPERLGPDACLPDGSLDPRRINRWIGSYFRVSDGAEVGWESYREEHRLALTWLLQSSRWRPHWQAARKLAGTEEFTESPERTRLDRDEMSLPSRKQVLWENVMVCQGLEGLGMMRPDLREAWFPKIRRWRDRIERMKGERPGVPIGRQSTDCYPDLLGDLGIAIRITMRNQTRPPWDQQV